MKIAILSINTGKYNMFFTEFKKTCDENFLCEAQKEYFVFTDIPHKEKCHIIQISDKEWPYITLERYDYFVSIESELIGFDYCIYLNSNCIFNKKIQIKDIIDINRPLLSCKHVYLNRCDVDELIKSTESNPVSHAFIDVFPYKYVCGGLVGGKPHEFITMSKTISQWKTDDLKNGIIPIWHDESYLNKYRLLNKDLFNVLPHTTLFPEDFHGSLSESIIRRKLSCITLRDKKKFFDVVKFKSSDNNVS